MHAWVVVVTWDANRGGVAQPNARQAEVVPLSFGSVVSPGPFALLAQKLKDFRKDRCKESL